VPFFAYEFLGEPLEVVGYGHSDDKRVPFCAYEFSVQQLQIVDSKLAAPGGADPYSVTRC
jgi:hypothetical protein